MHVSLLNLVFLLQVLQVAKKKKVMRCLNLDCKPSWSESASEMFWCKIFLHKQEVDEACGHQTLQHQGLQLLP